MAVIWNFIVWSVMKKGERFWMLGWYPNRYVKYTSKLWTVSGLTVV